MSPFRSAVSVFLSCFLSLSLAAQQSAPAQQSNIVQQGPLLLHRALAAMTGGGALRDVVITGTARRIAGSDDESGTATLKALPTGESRIDLSFPSGARTEVRANSDAGPAGHWSGPDGTPHSISQHNMFAGNFWFFSPFTLAEAVSTQDSVVSYVGHDTFDDSPVEHLSISRAFTSLSSDSVAMFQHLSQMELYLDSTTLLPRALAFNIHPDNNALLDIPVIVRYSDYRPVAPASSPASSSQIAFHIQKFLNNTLVLDLQFQSANFNTGLSATDFNLASSSPPGPPNIVAASHLTSAVKP
jgi:hypothetical protein